MDTELLDGVRVIDLGQYILGPFAAQILADLGAEVLKVEPPRGEPMRRMGPIDKDGVAAFYKLYNRGKRVVELDLAAGAGAVSFAALVSAADVLVEGYRPGALARLGFSSERLAALNPRIVHCILSGWGGSGPYARRAGHDVNYMALGGGLAASGPAEAPAIAYPPVADHASAVQVALAVTAALFRRQRTGTGAVLDVSLMESVLAWQAMNLTQAARGHPPLRAGETLNGGAAFYNLYRTHDGGWISLGAVEAKFWANFCRAVGREDWAPRHGEALPQTALIAEVVTLIAGQPLAHWRALLDPVECCFEAVLDVAEVTAHPQILARGFARTHLSPEPLVEVLFPARIDGAPPRPRAPVAFVTPEEAVAAWI
ncbi:MAG: CoA transferase [Alphaproteobacteria bacterium]